MIPLSKMKPNKRKPAPGKRIGDDRIKLLIDARGLREKQGVTLRDCVKPSGISSATLLRIEEGRAPDLATALRFARFVEMPVEEVWRLKDDMARRP